MSKYLALHLHAIMSAFWIAATVHRYRHTIFSAPTSGPYVHTLSRPSSPVCVNSCARNCLRKGCFLGQIIQISFASNCIARRCRYQSRVATFLFAGCLRNTCTSPFRPLYVPYWYLWVLRSRLHIRVFFLHLDGTRSYHSRRASNYVELRH